MGRPEDSYVKIPALVHATRVGYSYLSIRDKRPNEDYDSRTNVFFEPFKAAVERLNGCALDDASLHHLVDQIAFSLDADDLGKSFFAHLQSNPFPFKAHFTQVVPMER